MPPENGHIPAFQQIIEENFLPFASSLLRKVGDTFAWARTQYI